jgi:hypothetical protein
VNIKFLAAVESGSIEYPLFNHRSTDKGAIKESARRLIFEYFSSIAAESDQFLFEFSLVFALLVFSYYLNIRPVVLSIVFGDNRRYQEEIWLAPPVGTN